MNKIIELFDSRLKMQSVVIHCVDLHVLQVRDDGDAGVDAKALVYQLLAS